MTDIIKHWIVKKLGLPVSFNRGGDRLRQELSNGHLIGEILRKYHLISDDMLMNLNDSVCHHHREKNMHILSVWLHGMSFELEASELHDISQGKPGSALAFLYRLYLWLEGPGSQPGIHPRQKKQDLGAPSEDTIEGRENIPFVINRYTQKQADAGGEDALLTFEGFDQNQPGPKKRSSLFVNAVSKLDLENVEGKEELEESESFSELKSTDFLESLTQSLSYKNSAFGGKTKLVVSPASVSSLDVQGGKFTIPSTDASGQDKISSAETQKLGAFESSELESEPYLEVDDKGLDALQCGQLPSFYVRNFPYGNANEKLQAGNLYFHSKAMMVLNELKNPINQEFKNLPTLSRTPCENESYIGAFEEAMLYRRERKRRKTLTIMENTVDEMNKFEEKLLENSDNASGACDDYMIKVYPNGRGDWTEARAKINSLKARRRRDKICFQKRGSTRKMMAVLISKLNTCDTHEELDKVIHSKLLQKSKQEILLAQYCTESHLEKRAFVNHTKHEEELLLKMAMIQNYRDYLHAEQLEIIKQKVDKITEDCDDQIINEVQKTKQKALFIMDIKFCEEIFMVILKTAIQYSDYRKEYGSDPPTALVAEWRDSFYMGSCVTMVKKHIRRIEKPKSTGEEYAQEHADRCKKKKREKKEKAMLKVPKKSKSSVQSLKSNNSFNQIKKMSTILEYVEEEELPVIHHDSDGKLKKKKKHSVSKKTKRKEGAKGLGSDSKNSIKSDKDKKISFDVADEEGHELNKIHKKSRKDSNDKKLASKSVKEFKRKGSGKNNEMDTNSKIEPEDTKGKGKKTGTNAGEAKRDSKDLTGEKVEGPKSPDAGKKAQESEKGKPNKAKPGAKTKNAGKGDKKAKKIADEKNPEVDNDEEEEEELPEEIKTGDAPEKEKKPKKPAGKAKKTKK